MGRDDSPTTNTVGDQHYFPTFCLGEYSNKHFANGRSKFCFCGGEQKSFVPMIGYIKWRLCDSNASYGRPPVHTLAAASEATLIRPEATASVSACTSSLLSAGIHQTITVVNNEWLRHNMFYIVLAHKKQNIAQNRPECTFW